MQMWYKHKLTNIKLLESTVKAILVFLIGKVKLEMKCDIQHMK